jgi:DNA-binding transcriptional LysR family regulator
MLPVAASDHPLGSVEGPVSRDLASRHRQIVLSERLSHAADTEGGVFATDSWRVGDMRIKHELLLSGVGWGFMPANLVEGDIAAGRLRRLRLDFTNELKLPMVAAWRRAIPLGPVARELVGRLGAAGGLG